MKRAVPFLLVSLSLSVGVLACEGTLLAPTDCGEIPEGGCIDKGASVDQCGDVTCVALYTCVGATADAPTGTWQEARECPARPAPPVVDAGTDASDAAAPPRDASLPDDLPPGAAGGPGCIDLQFPDCALAVGYGCATACCGCEALFVCENGGWEPWGSCVDDVPTAE